MVYFITLDRKNRIVLPVTIREKLGITDSIVLKIDSNKAILQKPNGEFAFPISRNISEIDDGDCSVTVSTGDCGSPRAGSTPASRPQELKTKKEL